MHYNDAVVCLLDRFQGYPRLIADDWAGIESVGACLTFLSEYTANTIDSGELTYLFSQGMYQIFVDAQPVGAREDIKTDWGLPLTPDAAFQWRKAGAVYFTLGIQKRLYFTHVHVHVCMYTYFMQVHNHVLGNAYYRFSSHRQRAPDEGYPRKLEAWDERLDKIDAAFQWSDRKTYFFQGKRVFEIDDSNYTVQHCPCTSSTLHCVFMCMHNAQFT